MENEIVDRLFLASIQEENARLRQEIAQLRASDGQLRLLADFSPALISYVDREERYRFMNRQYTEWFGFDPSEVIGKTVLEVVGQFAYDKSKIQVREALMGKHMHFENNVVMKSGRTKIVDLQFVPFWEANEVNGFIILGYDITDRKKAELAVRETQKRLEFALESAKMSSWYLDLKTNQVSSTPGATPLMGYEIQRKSLIEAVRARVHPDDVEDTLKSLTESILEQKPYQHEYRQIQSDGTYRWMLSRAMPQYDEDGSPISISGVMVDFTERRQSEDLYRAVTELTPQFIWTSDARGAITFSNATMLNYMGVNLPQTIGDRWLEMIHPDDRERTIEAWQRSLSTGETYEVEFRIRSKEGVYGWFLNRALPMWDKRAGRIDRWLGVSTDITKLKETESAVIKLAAENARLFTQAQDAVNLRDEFLSIASHELKTPITAMKLQIQINKRRFEKEPHIFADKKLLEKLLDSTSTQLDRLCKLVDDMLDISRISNGKLILEPMEVDLGFLVRDVVDRFHDQLSAAGCRYLLNLESSVIGCWDRYRIEQVLTNLITNAMKYGASKPIEIAVLNNGKSAVLKVKDHGIGIPAESLEKIFDRFERVGHEKGISGLGLGLYISRQIIDAHHGKIHVLSEIGKGSTFTVELPF